MDDEYEMYMREQEHKAQRDHYEYEQYVYRMHFERLTNNIEELAKLIALLHEHLNNMKEWN